MLAISRLSIAVVFGLYFSRGALAAPTDDFRRGVEAFESQEYELALRYFTAVQEAGARTPELHYNLGVVYFRLGQYDKALDHLRTIEDDTTWGALAHYNIGLIEERRGHVAQALKHYRSAHDRARTPRVEQLTAAKLRTATAAHTDEDGWRGLISTAGGFDDNVLLLEDGNAVGAANRDDYYVEASGAANGYLRGGFEDGWRCDLAGYYRAYRDVQDFNIGSGNFGVFYGRALQNWHLQVGAKADLQFVGADYFSTAAVFSAEGTRILGSLALRIRNDFRRIEGGDQFEYVSGWQNVTGIDVTRRSANARLRFGYEYELNDRDDLMSTDEFFSYSPVRHKLYANVRRELSGQFRFTGGVEYRASTYADENVQVNADGSITTAKRDEERLTAMLRLGYEWASSWELFAEYQYARNDSNLDRYSYENNQVLIGLDRSF